MNNPGNPIMGQLPYDEEHPEGTTSYTYFGLDISTVIDGEGCYVVTVHAVQYNPTTGETETAWLFGDDYPGQSWAMFANVNDCILSFLVRYIFYCVAMFIFAK